MIEKITAVENWLTVISILIGLLFILILTFLSKLKQLKKYIENDEKEKNIILKILKLGDAYKLPKGSDPDLTTINDTNNQQQTHKTRRRIRSPFSAKHYLKKFTRDA